MRAEKEAIRCELLVLRWRRGDAEALEELIRSWERPLLYFIGRLVGAEADAWDVLQETWVKAVRALRTMREPRAVPALLYTIARSAAMSHLRRRPSSDLELYGSADGPDPPASDDDGPPEQVMQVEDAAAVHQALGTLSLPHREILTLHFLQDLSIDEAAAVVGVPPGTVKSRLYYAKLALRRALESGESGGDRHAH